MFRKFFPRGYTRYERSRFARELDDFGGWLQAKRYSCECARGHLFRLRDSLARFAGAKPGAKYTALQLEAMFGRAHTGTRRSMLYRATQRAYQRFLCSRDRLAIVPVDEPFAELRHRYRQELLDVRGLCSETVQQHERTIDDFLSHTLCATEGLESLTSADVDQYLALKSRAVGRQRLQHVVAHLRTFFRFCRANDRLRLPIDVIDTVRVYRDELPPRALPWPLVEGLLSSINRLSRSGWRDYALLHLMAHYGLRPSEVVSLRLGSIDWSGRTLSIEQRKTRSALLLPLADRTVSILQCYLQRGRSHSLYPQLFLRARCPAGALTRHAVTDIFKKRAAQSGLPIEGYCAYSLRHAFAMRLLQRGVGLKAIGDLLGHGHLGSTCQYLRLDIDMLRGVALPVPDHTEAVGGAR